MAAQVERQREGQVRRRSDRFDGQPVGDRVERRVPAMIDPRRMRDAELAEHLADEVERGEGRLVAGDIECGPVA